ncbi:MAG: nuclear transport factor 2 family protein [Verrucomicrobia bacterium]|nr:nuclear transport factor 2 family protein [Cytophagales bacterium]
MKKAVNETHFSAYFSPLFLLVTFLSLSLSGTAIAQSQTSSDVVEKEIRKLEAEQIEYVLTGKIAEMKKNWHPNHTVNNPFGIVQNAATGPMQAGTLTYSKFERNIEKVLVQDSVVVVMGNELVIPKTVPKGSLYEINQPIKRRFTNVWMHKDGKWLMIARHANDICPN